MTELFKVVGLHARPATEQGTPPGDEILRGLDLKGEPAEVTMKGYGARIFQHEVDHLNGKVYLDRMPDLTSLSYTIVL